MDLLVQQLINGLALGSLYALIAVGYTVVYGIVQLINFAHGEVFMIGAFAAFSVSTYLFPGVLEIWVLPIMVLAASLASVGVAVLLERWAYRPLRNAPRLAPFITAIGVSVFLQEAVRLFYPGAKGALEFPQIKGVSGQALQVGTIGIPPAAIFTWAALVVCTTALWVFVKRTRTGRAMQAVSQDPDTAKLMGINVDRIIVIAFAVGAVLAGVAGVAQGLQFSSIQNSMGFLAGLKAFTAAVLGGIGNIGGAVVGGLVLGLTEALATQLIPAEIGGQAWSNVVAFALLIIVLVFRPEGLLGARVVDRA